MHDPQQTPAPQARLAQNWRRYLRFWGARAEADVDDELRFHVDMRVRDYMSRGMSEADARAAVFQRLGAVNDVRDECVAISQRRERRMTRAYVVDAFLQDLRFALRGFGRQKGWTAIAVLTLALGIGANTAVFSVVNSLVLNPLPYPDADRIALIFMAPSKLSETGVQVTISADANITRHWMTNARSFEQIEPFRSGDVTFQHRDEPTATLRASWIRPSFPRFAGASPVLGRMFDSAEVAAKAPVVLLGEATWRTRFGADPQVIGRAVTIDDKPYSVIGVMSSRLMAPRIGQGNADLWLPADLSASGGQHGFTMVGRLTPGTTPAVATAELDTLLSRMDPTDKSPIPFRAQLSKPSDMVGYKQSLFLLMGAVGFVLLIACVNVAHLMLARAAVRQRELAVRVALGAAKGRLLRQMLTESLVLSLAGCVGGIVVAFAGIRALRELRPENLAELGTARVDGVALLAAVAIAVLTAIGFGVFAAVQSSRSSTHDALKTGALTTSQSRGQHRLRGLLVITEMAMSTMLLVGAALLVRSVISLQTSDTGFDPKDLYAVSPNLPESRYKGDAAKDAFMLAMLERVKANPAFAEATVASSGPIGFSFLIGALQPEGQEAPPPGTTNLIRFTGITPSYFRTMRLPIVEGRALADTTKASAEIMVNEGFATKHWAGQSAVGKRLNRIGFDGKDNWYTVVGVVANAATGGLTHDRADPILYTPMTSIGGQTIIVRARPGTDALPALRALVASLDPRLPPPTLTNVENALKDSASLPRFTMFLLVGFTGLALILAAIGLYGVMSYGVTQRTREIGIRMALGASRGDVSRAVVKNGLGLAVIGVVIGIGAAWWGTQLLTKLLYGTSPTDAASFLVGATVLLGTAVLACVVPMNRAASIDPAIAMRAD